MIPLLRPMAAWLCLILIVAPVGLADLAGTSWGVALAQDDDGDDGDDDDGPAGGGGDDDDDAPAAGGGDDDDDAPAGRPAPVRDDAPPAAAAPRRQAAPPAAAPRQPARPARPAPAPPARPDFAPELVVSDLSEADLAVLLAEGFALLERRTITTLGVTLDRLAAPAGQTLEGARDRVRQLPTGSAADSTITTAPARTRFPPRPPRPSPQATRPRPPPQHPGPPRPRPPARMKTARPGR